MPSSNIKDFKWLYSTGAGNLCGFASFIHSIQHIINNPSYYEGLEAFRQRDNLFLEMCQLSNAFRPGASDEEKAAAIKRAFAETILADQSNETPFDSIFDMVILEFLQPNGNLNDYQDFMHEFIQHGNEQLNRHYANYKVQIEAEINFQTCSDSEKKNLKENWYQDGTRFINYLRCVDPQLINEAKQHYCTHLAEHYNNYRAREIDILYIAKQMGCFKHLYIHNIAFPNTPILNVVVPNANLELRLKNSGNH